MPKAAWECGAAQVQLPLDRIASHLIGRFEAAHHPENSAAAAPS